MGGPPLQNVSPAQPSGLNPRPTSHGIYNHAIGGPSFQHNPLTRPPSMVLGSPDAINLSAVEVYRQKHEVTATVRILSPYNNCHVTYLKKPLPCMDLLFMFYTKYCTSFFINGLLLNAISNEAVLCMNMCEKE